MTMKENFKEKQKHIIPDGKIQSQKFYKNGELEGMSAAWDEEGKLMTEAWYVDGKARREVFPTARKMEEKLSFITKKINATARIKFSILPKMGLINK